MTLISDQRALDVEENVRVEPNKPSDHTYIMERVLASEALYAAAPNCSSKFDNCFVQRKEFIVSSLGNQTGRFRGKDYQATLCEVISLSL